MTKIEKLNKQFLATQKVKSAIINFEIAQKELTDAMLQCNAYGTSDIMKVSSVPTTDFYITAYDERNYIDEQIKINL